jgi:uncharacterized protein
MKLSVRNIHRDFGYFYVGLIISFALSGLMMNHRDHWNPEKYTINATTVKKVLPIETDITEAFVKKFVINELQIKDKIKRHSIRKGKLKITCENHDVEFDLATGEGEIVEFKKTPLISQMMFLHKTTSNWWIYYSDIFALSLITIATTGILLIPKGRLSFKERGWKLAIAGIIFPLLFLIFLS